MNLEEIKSLLLNKSYEIEDEKRLGNDTGRKRVAILLKDQENMERPSDIQGLIYIPFKDNLEKEAGLLLAKEMAAQGYSIDVSRL